MCFSHQVLVSLCSELQPALWYASDIYKLDEQCDVVLHAPIKCSSSRSFVSPGSNHEFDNILPFSMMQPHHFIQTTVLEGNKWNETKRTGKQMNQHGWYEKAPRQNPGKLHGHNPGRWYHKTTFPAATPSKIPWNSGATGRDIISCNPEEETPSWADGSSEQISGKIIQAWAAKTS